MATRTHKIAILLLQAGGLIKLKTIAYWIATVILTCELLTGGIADLIHGPVLLFAGDSVILVVAQLGYPVYLLTILGVWKLLGTIALLLPGFPRLKEWAYAGIFFEMTGAAASWAARGAAISSLFWPLAFAVLALVSWALRPQKRILGPLFPGRTRSVGIEQRYGQDVSGHVLF
ncbi:DoxX family protein [Ktedonosporobacter rubrisoli]|uniref:DoxX family protein n=1 Tax=Ktedonosporobacter rubrisoli TaxID=2509675 RepID=A0A4P6JLX7_KTERU|nr:DoxX family protein [Ktedonosporobacter rubrisoli]QBD76002.1 DoxX family protein [Ktedonosporobacter rubrisoli]